jgi:hypothetical protein
LTDNGYGERITRHDRSALLNMALNLDVTRDVLQQTIRRSWRLIWEEEVRPRLPTAGQPTDAEKPEAPEDKPTRRPKKANGKKRKPKEQWSGDSKRFFADGLVIFNNAIAMKKTALQCTPEQRRKLQGEVDSFWLDKSGEGIEALVWLRDWLNGALEEKAKKLMREGRVRTTPARASAVDQPPA